MAYSEDVQGDSSTSKDEPTLQEIVASLPFPAALNEIEGKPRRILLFNEAFTETFGYDINDCPTVEDWARLAYPEEDYRLRTFEAWDPLEQKALREQGAIKFQEVEVCTKDGRTLNVLISARALGARLLVAFVDMTSQRQTEAELRNVRYSLERTAYELTENLPVGTYTMVQPPDGGMAQFRFLSKRFLEISGLKSRELAFEDPRNVFVTAHPEDLEAWVALNEKTFAERIPFYGEKRIIVDGEIRWISAESRPRALPDGSTLWEGVLTDITDRKLAQESLARAKARAEQLERIKSEFLTRMSHEIRTPLTLVLGLTDLLADECDRASQIDKVEQLRNAGNMLLGIVNDILDLSKIEAGQLITEEMPFALGHLINHIRAFEASITQPNVTLQVHCPPIAQPILIGDQRRIEQILGNLIGNAIKFTERGTITVSLTLIPLDNDKLQLTARVKDTGRGIPAGQIPELFSPFTQGDASIWRQYGGTGLGLSISKELVELMGGRIGVESQVGVGSEFWFELPLQTKKNIRSAQPVRDIRRLGTQHNIKLTTKGNRPGTPLGTTPGTTALTPKPLQGLRILVVDDSLSIRSLIRALLMREGAQVEVAEDGSVAVDTLQAIGHLFDCVMMDVQMPVVDGLTATRQIRQIPRLDELPILAMTAGLLAEQQIRAREAGMTDLVAKPIQPAEMVDQILGAVGRQVAHAIKKEHTENHIPAIAGINRYHANRALDANLDMFNFLAQVFVEEFDGFADRIYPLVAKENGSESRKTAMRLAHSLKGSAKQIGALDLSEMADQLETALASGAGNWRDILSMVRSQLSDLIRALKQYLQHEA